MLGKTEGRRRRGLRRMRCLDSITDSMYMSLSKLWDIVKDREAWHALVHPVMLPSEVPRLGTDSPVKVFPGVWKLLSFLRLPSWDGYPSLPLLSLFLSFMFFSLPPFEDNGLPFWVPDVFCQHSEVVLWNLLSFQMFFP